MAFRNMIMNFILPVVSLRCGFIKVLKIFSTISNQFFYNFAVISKLLIVLRFTLPAHLEDQLHRLIKQSFLYKNCLVDEFLCFRL